jgi:hypothetical protein
MWTVLAILLIAGCTALVIRPLMRAPGRAAPPAGDLLAGARETLYRQMREAELEHAAGRISEETLGAALGDLRAQAVALLPEPPADPPGEAQSR